MANTLEILKRWNPWEKEIDAGIKRPDYIKHLFPFFERKEIIVLKGIRRCGKSTIIKQLILELLNHNVDKKQILYVNLEDYGFADNLKIELFDEILRAYRMYVNNKKRIYFFIDETQKIPGWEKWVRTKYDLNENIKFIVTGSSAYLLSKELSTLLTGRNLSFNIMPLSFAEYCLFTKDESLDKYFQFGGFPEVVLEKSEEKKRYLLQQYFDDIIYKDIIDRYKIRNTQQITALARYLVATSRSKVSINKLSRVFGLSKETISLYISYMINAFLLFEVTYFSYSAKIKHEVSKLPRLYVVDSGLLNIVNSDKGIKHEGQLFENAVLIKLLENYKEISYWGELESEVDFIVDKTAINVTSTNDIPKREFKGLNDFKAKHQDFKTLLISNTLKKEGILPIREFLRKGIE